MLLIGVCVTVLIWTVACADTLKYQPKVPEAKVGENVVTVVNKKVSIKEECNFPPSVWCSSRQVARLCQVEFQCEHQVWKRTNRTGAAPVRFALYFESLCPDCKQFITEMLWTTWKKVGKIMDLQLVPYGNAEETRDGTQWKFDCQHGPDECKGNLIETCAIHVAKDINVYFPFIHCIESSDSLPVVSAPKCAKNFGLDYAVILDCVNGPLGNQLEHQMAAQTGSLQPPHTWVPWVTLNGIHTDEIQDQAMENLQKLICDTYQGAKPEACDSKHHVHHMGP